MRVNKIANSLLEAVFPQYCLLCRLRSCSPLPLCADCFTQLQGNEHACQRCALPLATAADGLCSQCIAQPPAFDSVIAPLVYEPHIALLISRWKFQRERRLTRLLALLWHAWVVPPTDRDLLLPVPLHWRRLLWRGFNQAALLGLAIRAREPQLASLPLGTDTLQRRRATPAQASLNAQQRSSNLETAFRVRGDVRGLRVAVIDDVMTTGATADAIARALKAAGAADVQLWCLARTPAPGS
ncbi:ComF family protein [Haliea sp. E1-2-M8]|uniref:ComF family protein n=1 Tax=Haliea sp. E1-2-M8 TaxID=3064706 RepID=UPI002716ED7E|nr:ComF family protein [Haliea sp. E1-2-M8]MDO8860990.1 ComF family protein [Haliea sp. E1-2-M8]